jgi:hypothetical protein
VAARPQGAGVRSGDGRSTRGLRVAPIVAVGILGVAAAAGVGAGSAATQGAIASDAADEAHFLQAVIRGEILKPAQLSELKNDYGGSYGPALQSSRMVANRPASPTATTAAALATRTASRSPPTAAASPSCSPTATPSRTATPPRCAEPTLPLPRCSVSTAQPHKVRLARHASDPTIRSGCCCPTMGPRRRRYRFRRGAAAPGLRDDLRARRAFVVAQASCSGAGGIGMRAGSGTLGVRPVMVAVKDRRRRCRREAKTGRNTG